MAESFDREKVVECMFDPTTAAIIASLEDGKKECSFLAQQESITESQVLERLAYLLEHKFLYKDTVDGKCFISANPEKLCSIVEEGENFDGITNELEKMDSYLN